MAKIAGSAASRFLRGRGKTPNPAFRFFPPLCGNTREYAEIPGTKSILFRIMFRVFPHKTPTCSAFFRVAGPNEARAAAGGIFRLRRCTPAPCTLAEAPSRLASSFQLSKNPCVSSSCSPLTACGSLSAPILPHPLGQGVSNPRFKFTLQRVLFQPKDIPLPPPKFLHNLSYLVPGLPYRVRIAKVERDYGKNP
jgi:hypothetical protein